MKLLLSFIGILIATVCFALPVFGEEKKETKDEKKPAPPRVVIAIPLAASVGATNAIVIRGQNLTNVTGLSFTNEGLKADVTIKSRGKADVPKDSDAKKSGDARIELELFLPADVPHGTNYFVVTSPDGVSEPRPLVFLPAGTLVDEQEPNGGFKQAREIHPGQTVSGLIREAGDVDVFRFGGKAGQRVRLSVRAAWAGSGLDSLITLYGEHGHVLAEADDGEIGRDSLLRAKLPADGGYFISIIDAHDKGGPTHAYLLLLSEEN